ncbi:sugar ABC transporter permease [Sporanaerobium hydrogeniformans]|uniref:Sugar ABC transporter permease n=1 Tax=Sporanaerobium hydrogeniformans TaxID=3072179 RepID=A0AC61DF28_9FIRM|nr:carbohydrate ABC transporter permease [Sporanaerobium hydrogeniformans]PHV71197.1 sugar ABC transporter permease [Sporanaerobium hydrogeniformans]
MNKLKSNPLGFLFIIIKYISLIVGAIITLLPLAVIFLASFKTSAEYGSTGILELPASFLNFENYIIAFTKGNMLVGFANTFINVSITLLGSMICGTMIAYILHRFQFAGRKVILGLFLIATFIPAITTQVATFQIMNYFKLFNTRWSVILLGLGTDIVSVYIFLQFLDGISYSLDESAMLEGASMLKIYTRIILPLLKPAIATAVILKTVNLYNDFYSAFLYMPKQRLHVVSTALFKFKGPYGSNWEVISAGVVVIIVPTLILFLALQKYIYNGVTAGSVK